MNFVQCVVPERLNEFAQCENLKHKNIPQSPFQPRTVNSNQYNENNNNNFNNNQTIHQNMNLNNNNHISINPQSNNCTLNEQMLLSHNMNINAGNHTLNLNDINNNNNISNNNPQNSMQQQSNVRKEPMDIEMKLQKHENKILKKFNKLTSSQIKHSTLTFRDRHKFCQHNLFLILIFFFHVLILLSFMFRVLILYQTHPKKSFFFFQK